MIDARLLLRAAVIGTVLQFAVTAAGHFFQGMAPYWLLFGWMMAAATAGYLYGLMFGRGYAPCALGGAVAGGLGAAPALAVAVLLGDSPAAMVATGTGIAVLVGGVGGAFGQIGANLRKLGF